MTHKEFLKTVGMEFKVSRIRKNLTRPQLGKLTGIGDSTIMNMENGNADAKILTYKRIADALGKELKDFM